MDGQKDALLLNVGHVDYHGARLWCHAVYIDRLGKKLADTPSRQIRGLTYGGMPVFTCWLNPDDSVEVEALDGGKMLLLSHDGNTHPLDGGALVRVNGVATLAVLADDFRRPVEVRAWPDRQPFGDELDELILPYCGGSNYPRPAWQPIPERFRRKQ